MNTERRPDQRKTYLNKIRKSGKTSTAPLVYYKGTSFDRIIFEWIRDLEKATDAIKKALEIASKMTEEDWSQDNNNYAATCKWIQTGLDSIQQWDSESGKSATAITSLPWKNLRAFRNNLTHAFQDTPPDEVKTGSRGNATNPQATSQLDQHQAPTNKKGRNRLHQRTRNRVSEEKSQTPYNKRRNPIRRRRDRPHICRL